MNKTCKAEKIVLFLIMIFVFFSMYYYDNQITFVDIMANMHRIASGKWYYLFNGWSSIPYGLILQAACAIWSLPVFVLSEMGIISTVCIGARLWYKLFVLIFLILDAKQLGSLARDLGIESEKKILWIQLYFLSSLSVILPAGHIAQMDTVYLFPILLGISFYLRNEYKKFLLCFAIAIPIKFLPLFIFIPLVLLKEKRYLYILRDLGIGVIGILFDKAMKSIGYRIEMRMGIDPSLEVWDVSDMVIDASMGNLLENSVFAFNTQFSIAICLFVFLCIWCYVKKETLHQNLAIYTSLAGLSCLLVFGTITPYWIVLTAPFILLLIFENDKLYRVLLPLELAFSGAFLYIAISKINWIYGSEDTFSFLLFQLIPGYVERIHGYISDFLKQRNLVGYDGIFSALCISCIGGIMVLTNPMKETDADNDSDTDMYLKWWYWGRIAVLIGWLLLNIWVVAGNHVLA